MSATPKHPIIAPDARGAHSLHRRVGRPRGSVKRYREHLNALDVGDSKHMHLHQQQRTRKYGDYLYNQDRERFTVELDDWLKSPNNKLRDAGGEASEQH